MSFYLIIIVLAVAAFTAVFFLFRAIDKKNLNRRLNEDRETLAMGGTPSGVGRHEPSSLEAVSLIFGIIAFAVSLIYFGFFLTSKIEDRLDSMQSSYSAKINTVLSKIAEIQQDQKNSRSVLASFTVTLDEDGFDGENLTVRYTVEIIPKAVSADTAVSVTLDGKILPTLRNGNAFTLQVERNLFSQKTDTETVTVSVTSGGISQNEVLTTDDTSLFSTLDDLFYPDWTQYFTTFTGMSTVIGHQTGPYFENGVFNVDLKMEAEARKGLHDVTKCIVRAYDGDRLLWEKDYTDAFLAGEDDGYYRFSGIELKDTRNDITSGCVDIAWSITDECGYTVSTHDRTFSDGSCRVFPYWVITAPDGTVIYKN